MANFSVKVYYHPWGHSLDDNLETILESIAIQCAESVAREHAAGTYARDSLGIAILDPTAPLWKPSTEVLLATIAIGPDGEQFVTNAIAKAVHHRDKQQLAGYGVHVDLTQSADGDFAYGFSTQVDGTIAGASGQSELQDAVEAGHALVEFNYAVRATRKRWLEAQDPRPRWFCDQNEPDRRFREMQAAKGYVFDGSI